jgi:hypothetical protein
VKKAAVEPLFFRFQMGRGLLREVPVLEAFFRQSGAERRALAGLEFRVGFADDVHRSFAFHNLAIGVTALGGGEGRKDFHGVK